MNNELMSNRDFVRCSALVAELLMKYKSMELKENEVSGESEKGSPPSFFILILLKNVLSSFIIRVEGDYY